MRAVRTGKGIADIDIAKPGQRRRKPRIIRLFPGMKAQIFHHHQISIGQPGNRIPRALAKQISLDRHRAAKQVRQARGNRRDREFRRYPALWSAKMGQDDELCASLPQRLQPRQDPPNSRVIRHRPIGKRHIQVKPDKTRATGGFHLIDKQEWRVH
jgi:hypothetical protein